jgi:FG-GAP-like repeat/RTX calcium-binding nonapeptide repeat (4 copies)/FG-GAP repeat
MPTLTGTPDNDLILGTEDIDTISGLAGNDELQGMAGADFIDAGSGDDLIIGGLDADILTGGTGVDRFRDTAAGLNGDRITDFLPGDRIQLTDLTVQNANIGVSGSTITFNGGSVAVDNLGPGRLIIRAIQTGGVEIRLQQMAENDFNGDGRSDILWRNDNGAFSSWLGQVNGGFVGNDAKHFTNVPTDWRVAGTGDFNGDGRVDVLWRNTNGTLSDWLSQANGTFAANDAIAMVTVSNSWHVDGVGDFNGDGRGDVLWRNDNGQLSNWLGQANGGFVANDANAMISVSTSWHVVGTGDFNGDGRDDILWRSDAGQVSDWLGTVNGGWQINDANAFTAAPTSWKVAGVGDFNGDGIDDILWRNDNGQVSNWLGQANGSFVVNDANALTSVGTNWKVASVGDFNGDGRDDILWRSDAGQLSDWLGTATGGWQNNDANAFNAVSNTWHVQGPDIFWPG